MSKIIFNEHQRRTLEANPNVKTVSDRTIQYTPEFKVKAVNENLQGKGPAQIFAENGFDLTVIGSNKPKETLKRWRKTFRLYGEDGFWEEPCGKGRSAHQIPGSRKRVVKKARSTREAGEKTQLSQAENSKRSM